MSLIGTNTPRDLHIEISDEDAPMRMNAVHKDALIRFWLEEHSKLLTIQYETTGAGLLVRAHRVQGGFSSDSRIIVESNTNNSIILR